MKHKKTITNVAFLLLVLGGIMAQETPTVTGGEAVCGYGTSSYSIEQVVSNTNTGTNGSIAQGVQHPYEVSIILGVNEIAINLQIGVYPKPTTNYLTLKVEENKGLNYLLFDIQGKVIENKKVNSSNTIITMETLPTATYFLKISKDNKIVKTYKIIKN